MRRLIPDPREGPFRIRTSDAEDPDYELKDQDYRTHLRGLGLSPDSDLLRFFGWDFFHDGDLSNLALSDDGKRLAIKAEGPNFRRSGTVDYLPPIGFTWTFTGLAHFEFSGIRMDPHNDPLGDREERITFMYAEIDSLSDDLLRLKAAYRRSFHSLIVEILPARRDLVVLFEDLKVVPDDPEAFEALVQDLAYAMPMWGRSQL